jgi:hypothetical protein
MDLGATMTKRIKKKAVRRIDPEISLDDAAIVDAEIDKQPDAAAQAALGMAQQLRTGAASRLNQLTKTTSDQNAGAGQ